MPAPPEDAVVTTPGANEVVARAQLVDIVAVRRSGQGPVVDVVGPLAAADVVVALAADDGVGGETAADLVVVLVADERVTEDRARKSLNGLHRVSSLPRGLARGEVCVDRGRVHRGRAEVRERDTVLAPTAVQLVVALAEEPVLGVGVGAQLVVSTVAIELVVLEPAPQPIRAAPTVQLVIAWPAPEVIRSADAVEDVRSGVPEQ